jgi:hypothetical protein
MRSSEAEGAGCAGRGSCPRVSRRCGLQMRSDCVVPTSSPVPPDAARRLRSFMRVTSWPPCSSPRAPASSSTASSISAPRLFPLLPYAADLVKFATAACVRVRPRATPAVPLHQHGSGFLVVVVSGTGRGIEPACKEVVGDDVKGQGGGPRPAAVRCFCGELRVM